MPARRVILRGVAIGAVFALLGGACHGAPRGTDSVASTPQSDVTASSVPSTLVGPTWTLVEIDGQPAPSGAGDRPVTMIFDAGAEPRASGFAGCNRWSSSVTYSARDQIRFTAPISTKMACSAGMDLEQRFLGMVMAVRSYTLSDSSLALRGETGTLARFARR